MKSFIRTTQLLTVAVLMTVGVYLPNVASAQSYGSCPTQNSDGSIQCSGSNRWCGNTCQADPGASCASNQVFSCSTCGCVCNTASFPCGGCTAASSTQGASCTGSTGCPTGGVFTNQCSGTGCPNGTVLCSVSNSCVSNTCSGGLTYDPATCSCSTAYVLKDQSSAQAAYVNITGNMTSTGGNLYLTGTGAGQGDVYLPNGKAVRVDGTGVTTLNFGNYTAGTANVLNLSSDGGLTLGSSTLDLGSGAGGQNVLYGVADGGLMHASDNLLLLQTYDAGVYNNRLALNKNGNLTANSFAFSDPSNIGSISRTYSGLPLLSISAGNSSTARFIQFNRNLTSVFSVDGSGKVTLGANGSTGLSASDVLLGGDVSTGATGKLMQFRVGGVNMFEVDAAGRIVASTIQLSGGSPGAGKVLTSDGTGLASWQTPTVTQAQFVGFADAAAAPGGAQGSYAAMNAACYGSAGAVAGSHMCSGAELLAVIAQQSPNNPFTVFNAVLGQSAWVSVGVPGFTSPAVNDCNGWSSSSGTAYGAIWTFANNGGRGYATTCSSSHKISCCK